MDSRNTVASATHHRSQKSLEALARDRKIVALLTVLTRAALATGVKQLTVAHVDGLDWSAIARIAGVNTPSAITVALLRRRLALGGA